MTTDPSFAMLEGHDIICLASQAWESHWCTPQQISVRLARYSRILYVEPLRSPLWWLKRSATQSRRSCGPARELQPNLWLLTLPPLFVPMILYQRLPRLRRLNNWVMSRLVDKACRKLGVVSPIVWVYQITYAGAPLLLRAGVTTVYDCIDEWAGATEDAGEKSFFTALDREMCRTADLLFVGSNALAAARRGLNPAISLVPQGVDLAHFLPPPQPAPAPADLAEIQRPVIGLVGVLNRERIDIGLLCHLADQRPQWAIVLVGPVWKGLDTDSLARRPNIHLLGNKPREELGSYLAAFDVCILPYLINDFTRNIFPLKLFEYLASGKPFVSTPIPACAEFPRLIRTADGQAAFLAAVDAALCEEDPALREERMALARKNDWDRRTADKAEFVRSFITARDASASGTRS